MTSAERVKHGWEEVDAFPRGVEIFVPVGEREVSDALARRHPLVGLRLIVAERIHRFSHPEPLDGIFQRLRRRRRRLPGNCLDTPDDGFPIGIGHPRVVGSSFAIHVAVHSPGRAHRAAVDVTHIARYHRRRRRDV